jgi:hypothetical protein
LHVKALLIRLRLGVPKAVFDMQRLAAYRSKLGAGSFSELLTQALGDADLTEQITTVLDNVS